MTGELGDDGREELVDAFSEAKFDGRGIRVAAREAAITSFETMMGDDGRMMQHEEAQIAIDTIAYQPNSACFQYPLTA